MWISGDLDLSSDDDDDRDFRSDCELKTASNYDFRPRDGFWKRRVVRREEVDEDLKEKIRKGQRK